MRKSFKYMARAILFVSTLSIVETADYLYSKPINAYAESDAAIKNITLSGGYDIDFSREKYSYVLDVDEDTDKIIIKAKPLYSNDKVIINGCKVTESDKYKQSVDLKEGKIKLKYKLKMHMMIV